MTTGSGQPALNHAPPRISDLRGDELTAALAQRAERHRDDWLRSRQRGGLVRRLLDRIGL